MLNQTLPKDLDLVLKSDTSELILDTNIILINTDRFINLFENEANFIYLKLKNSF
jgi:hypothetical protein